MPCCVIKLCRNYLGRLKTTHNVSYHRIPSDSTMKSRWVDIIRRSRGEELWNPRKTSVICSDHFREQDMYFIQSEKRRRLKKDTIPRKALFLSSQKSDDSESSDEDKGLTIDESENSDENKGLPSKKSLGISEDVQPSTSAKNEDDNGDFSDPDSISDTPKTSECQNCKKLRKELRNKIVIQKKHALKIQSFRRLNLHLRKQIAYYKQILKTLKKERNTDNN